ncbi:MAG: hypothetical protein HY665_03440 [Chloroflexi bacterium]|nr:hypothetical protein [Chloroflexota bacterium]
MLNDNATLVNKLSYEHEVMKRWLGGLRASVDEEEAVFVKQAIEQDVSRLQAVVQKQYNLLQSLMSFTAGIAEHAEREACIFPLLVGDTLAQGLVLEHQEIRAELSRIKSLLVGMDMKNSSREDLLFRSYDLRHATDRICHLMYVHMAKEDAILDLLKKVFNNSQVKAPSVTEKQFA